MSDPIGTAYIDSEGKQHGTPWPLRPTVPTTRDIQCFVCGGLKPWHLFSRKLQKGICSPCYEAGNRFGEKEG